MVAAFGGGITQNIFVRPAFFIKEKKEKNFLLLFVGGEKKGMSVLLFGAAGGYYLIDTGQGIFLFDF